MEKFALNEYTSALMKGDRLSDEERRQVARQLARYTGLTEDYVTRSNLRIDAGRFRKELLRKEEKTVGRYDSRFLGIDLDNVGEYPEYDPSYAIVQGPFTALVNQYLRGELKYETDLTYRVLTGKVQPWSYGRATNRYLNVAPNLRRAMTKNPSLAAIRRQRPVRPGHALFRHAVHARPPGPQPQAGGPRHGGALSRRPHDVPGAGLAHQNQARRGEIRALERASINAPLSAMPLFLQHAPPVGRCPPVGGLVRGFQRDIDVTIGVQEQGHVGQHRANGQVLQISHRPRIGEVGSQRQRLARRHRSAISLSHRCHTAPCKPCGSCNPGANRSTNKTWTPP